MNEPTMNELDMAKLALRAIDKRWDYEQLKYGDDLYGKSHLADDVWDLVEECRKIGTVAFTAKYITPGAAKEASQ